MKNLMSRLLLFSLVVIVCVVNTRLSLAVEQDDASERSLSSDAAAAESSDHDFGMHLPHHARLLVPNRIQVGHFSHRFSIPKFVPPHLRTGPNQQQQDRKSHPVSLSHWIEFKQPFRHWPVHVLVGISHFFSEQDQLRMRAHAEGANATGFFLVMGTWLEPHVDMVSASWLATDLPARQVQVLRHEQFMRTVEWGVREQTFSPPLLLRTRTVERSRPDDVRTTGSGSDSDSGTGRGATDGSGGDDGEANKKLVFDLVNNNLKPLVVPVISKLDQKGDAYWCKFEVQALSVTHSGFTSVLRPWGDAPTYWVAANYLASALPLSALQGGELAPAAGERLGSHVIRFAQRMLCDAPDVIVFTTVIDQGPVKRGVRVAASKVTREQFELYYDLRSSTSSTNTKFSWIAVC